MRLLQFHDPSARSPSRLGLVEDDVVRDLTSCEPYPVSIYDLYYAHGGDARGLDRVVADVDAANARARSLAELLNNDPHAGRPHLISPVTPPPGQPQKLRVWLAGVTHADSARLRETEAKEATGGAVNVYDQKYRECAGGGIPELFAKTGADALAGHRGRIARPCDTRRLVPETELVTVYGLDSRGQIERLGYTGGNDYTDNGIEAENPLNLPQAKNWAGGCASLGPVLVTDSEFDDAGVAVSCEILRDDVRIARKAGHTGQNHLNMPDRLFHLERSLFSRLPLPEKTLQLLYWGTPIVFSEADLPNGLQVDDVVRMSFSGIGDLENTIGPFSGNRQLSWLETNRRQGGGFNVTAQGDGSVPTRPDRVPTDPV